MSKLLCNVFENFGGGQMPQMPPPRLRVCSLVVDHIGCSICVNQSHIAIFS